MTAPDALVRLRTLVGLWRDVDDPVSVEYRMTANDTVLVETWTWHDTGMESLTLYHLNADSLIATHYCPVGNQPRLVWQPSPEAAVFPFAFVSATNLPDTQADHCVGFWIRLDGPEQFTRSETYEENGVQTVRKMTYCRET